MATIRGKKGNFNDTLVGTNKADTIYGLDGDDTIRAGADNDYAYGGNGADYLSGEAGHDRLYGEDGDDILVGGDGHDLMDGGAGSDTLSGDAGEDDLWGGDGTDTLSGGAGIDELIGGLGADVMTGGADRDYFFWYSRLDALDGDTITDFQPGLDVLGMLPQGDAADANVVMAGRQQWEFVGTTAGAPLANGNGQATVNYDGNGNTVLQLFNADGDTQADFTLTVNGVLQPGQLQIYAFSQTTSAFIDPMILIGP